MTCGGKRRDERDAPAPVVETTYNDSVATHRGLTAHEARARLAEFGPNRLVPEPRRPGLARWLLHALADPMVALLLAAGATYLALGDTLDAVIILVAVVPIMLVTLVLETRAERALEQLRRLTAPVARALRDGERQNIPSEDVVPDDLLFLQEGDIVPADGELIEGAQVVVDESALTGESRPVVKDADPALAETAVYAGTTVLSGRGLIRVMTTGGRTRYGEIGALMARIRPPGTPLQRLITRLVRQLAVVAVLFSLSVIAIELGYGRGWAAAIIAGVSLAIAAIPEEFPMVYTLYLTLGAWRLARGHALVRQLAGVETLGAASIICADKTGTLTLGRVDVAGVSAVDGLHRPGEPLGAAALATVDAAVLASEPDPFDPLEQAILRYAREHGVDVELLHSGQLVQDYPFDPSGKYISHVWQRGGRLTISAKGSTEGVLRRSLASNETRRAAAAMTGELAADGMRVIAVAHGELPALTGVREDDERYLRFSGLLAFNDPLRPGVADALRRCQEAGIRVMMITGDHPVTAHSVAESLGLPHRDEQPVATGDQLDHADDAALAELVRDVNIFARTRPEQKYRLVRALRAQGQVVAMTGDGINDAPALRESDIGVAMGQRGTEVARAAATIVLLDDNFATIVNAVRDGRRIFENLQRAFSYLVAFHTPLLLAALVVPLTGQPLLLLPVHLVWLELIVHPTSSLVFEADPPSPHLMQRPPRPSSASLISLADFVRVSSFGLSVALGALSIYFVQLHAGVGEAQARAMALTALLFAQIGLVFVERGVGHLPWRAGLRGNWALPGVLAATLGSLFLALYVPALARLLKLTPLDASQVAAALAVAVITILVPTLAFQLIRWPKSAISARR